MELQSIYGASSQAAFGSAVLEEQTEPGADLESIARHYYQHFVGKLWEKYGESAWMSTWKQVYARSNEIQPDIVAELRAMADSLAVQYVPILLLTDSEDENRAQQALATVFNRPQIDGLSVYAIGDGAAMSGLLLASSSTKGAITNLVSLMD